MICLCNKVADDQIVKLLNKSPLASVSDIARVTHASTSCGRCRRELELLVGEFKKGQLDNNSSIAHQLEIPFDC